MRCAFLSLALAGAGVQFERPDASAVAAAPSFAPGERVVATYYFYWYRHPDQHFTELGLHFPDESTVSYESEAWHKQQLEDMRAANIDVCLPVYWGARGYYDKPDLSFSVRGLPGLVSAADALEREGKHPPRIGMFYDTSTLANDVRGVEPRGARADLRTAEGRALFCGTIRDFFCQVPPRHWAQIEGQPLVVLYSSGFAGGFDQSVFDQLAEDFAREFAGKRPFVVRERSWKGVRTQGEYSWGAALTGVAVGERAVAIGPGYDDTAVRGRTTPIRQREQGRFYEQSWRGALRSEMVLALVETWNENHEGTSVAETVEYGRKYIELTARYAALFKRHETVAEDLALRWPDPVPRQDHSWGEAAKGASEVVWKAGVEASGIRPIPWEDGPFELHAAPEPLLLAQGNYVYFQLSDAFAFDVDAGFELELEFRDEGHEPIGVEYDSRDASATLHGAYTRAAPIPRSDSGGWRTATLALPHARFSNRENGLSDLRLCPGGHPLAVRALRLRR